jgi:succinate dehydrogenase hydrophobic anchor subunit
MKEIIPYILSAITIYMFLLAGNKKRSAWIVGLVNQALWLAWILLTQTWGLLPMNIALWIVYTRNYIKWGSRI